MDRRCAGLIGADPGRMDSFVEPCSSRLAEEDFQLPFDDGQARCTLILGTDLSAAVDEKREREPENSAI